MKITITIDDRSNDDIEELRRLERFRQRNDPPVSTFDTYELLERARRNQIKREEAERRKRREMLQGPACTLQEWLTNATNADLASMHLKRVDPRDALRIIEA